MHHLHQSHHPQQLEAWQGSGGGGAAAAAAAAMPTNEHGRRGESVAAAAVNQVLQQMQMHAASQLLQGNGPNKEF
jgi:hypothetical protein